MLAYATSTSSDSGSDEEFYELVDMHRLRKKLASKEYLSPDDPESCAGEYKLIADFSDTLCPQLFRFTQPELEEMCAPDHALRLPEEFATINRCVYPGQAGWLVFLYRMAYPCRLIELQQVFGVNFRRCSELFNAVLAWFIGEHGHLLTDLNIWRPYMQRFSEAIYKKGCPLRGVWGFIDGTWRPCCRPVIFQNVLYNTHYGTYTNLSHVIHNSTRDVKIFPAQCIFVGVAHWMRVECLFV